MRSTENANKRSYGCPKFKNKKKKWGGFGFQLKNLDWSHLQIQIKFVHRLKVLELKPLGPNDMNLIMIRESCDTNRFILPI